MVVPATEEVHMTLLLGDMLSDRELLTTYHDINRFRTRSRQVQSVLTDRKFDCLLDLIDHNDLAALSRLSTADGRPYFIVSPYYSFAYALPVILSLSGHPITFLHEALSDNYRNALMASGVDLISAERGTGNGHRVVARARRSIDGGRVLATIFDAPHRFGLPVRFFGRKFRVGNLYQLLARRAEADLIVLSISEEEGKLRIKKMDSLSPNLLDSSFGSEQGALQRLFFALEQIVRVQPAQYRWNAHSIVSSMEGYDVEVVKAVSRYSKILKGAG